LRTVGVEEEFLLVDPLDWRPKPIAATVLGSAAGRAAPEVAPELQLQQIETATPACGPLDEVAAELRHARNNAARAARSCGAELAALGTSPLAADPKVFPSLRYRRMADRFGLAAEEQLTCGCHVHVQIDSDDEGVGVLDRVGVWLSVLTALCANSPYWNGMDSRYASYRTQVWTRWPSAGPTAAFGSAEAYRNTVKTMTATDTILDDGMIYFDARLSRNFPTVEVRVADVCQEVQDAALLSVLVRALVDTASREWAAGVPVPEARVELLRLASWQASRRGLDGPLLHPATLSPAPAGQVADALLAHLQQSLEESGDQVRARELLDELLRRGNGARLQRADHRHSGRLEEVVARAVKRTHPQ
jgi:glutamate---cysteine ligase / carboxylate-amine ligase